MGEISKKVHESRLKWYEHVLRRVCKQEREGDGGGREKKERKTKAEVVELITPRRTCRGDNCQGRKRKAELNGGVS